jgi:hypothetical protein
LIKGSLCTFIFSVTTLASGSWPRQGLVKVQVKCEGWEWHFMLSGMWESVKEWTLTLRSELPLWKLELRWNLESSKSDWRGQNLLDWRVPYVIWTLQTQVMGRRKVGSQIAKFDSRPLKVKNRPNFLACRWRARYHWK